MLGNIGGPERAEWPVGTVMMRIDDVNPGTLLGYGTWEITLQGRFPLGAGAGYALGNEGGETTHKLTATEMPSHHHSYKYADDTGQSGTGDAFMWKSGKYQISYSGMMMEDTVGDQPHNNMPPYKIVSYWLRTA